METSCLSDSGPCDCQNEQIIRDTKREIQWSFLLVCPSFPHSLLLSSPCKIPGKSCLGATHTRGHIELQCMLTGNLTAFLLGHPLKPFPEWTQSSYLTLGLANVKHLSSPWKIKLCCLRTRDHSLSWLNILGMHKAPNIAISQTDCFLLKEH